jgi:hypothetical protein
MVHSMAVIAKGNQIWLKPATLVELDHVAMATCPVTRVRHEELTRAYAKIFDVREREKHARRRRNAPICPERSYL